MNRKAIGNTGVALTMLIAVAAAGAARLWGPASISSEGERGLCFPAPSEWLSDSLTSWIANIAVIALMAVVLSLSNRRFNFIKSTGLLPPAIFALLCGTDPFVTIGLSSSTLLCVVALLCIVVLMGVYKSSNATQESFAAATFVSLGSMCDASCIVMVPACLAILSVMKVLRVRETIAYILGLAAPFWVVLGMGIVAPESFSIELPPNPFTSFAVPEGNMALLVSAVFTGIVTLSLSLNIMMRLYAGNPRQMALNAAVQTIGFVAIAGMILDFKGFDGYLTTLYLCAAVQLANIFAIYHMRRPRVLLFFIVAIRIVCFILIMTCPPTK